jgi:hypothetical protein
MLQARQNLSILHQHVPKLSGLTRLAGKYLNRLPFWFLSSGICRAPVTTAAALLSWYYSTVGLASLRQRRALDSNRKDLLGTYHTPSAHHPQLLLLVHCRFYQLA